MSACETCGHDFTLENTNKERQNERLWHYRRALLLACGNDKQKMRSFMLEAEALLGTPEPQAEHHPECYIHAGPNPGCNCGAAALKPTSEQPK